MRPFENGDILEISAWFKVRGLQSPALAQLPAIGFIEEATAAGFLIRAECGIGFLDFYISNPDASSRERATSFKEITRALTAKARAHGIKLIMFNTKYPTLKKLAGDLQFKYLGEYSSFSGGV